MPLQNYYGVLLSFQNGPLKFWYIKRRIKETEKQLKYLQSQRPDQAMLAKCNELADELDELHRLEESYWHARARANEIRDGERIRATFTTKLAKGGEGTILRDCMMKVEIGVRNMIEGLIWRVGNGSNINVWSDTWVKGENGGHILVPNGSHDMNLRVSDLIDVETSSWNVERVRSIFKDDDCMRILAIPLPSSCVEDGRFWWPMKSRKYSVKSGYWLARLEKVNLFSSDRDNVETWRSIWNLAGPPKLRHFLWRACKGSLAVRQRLCNRHIIDDATCLLCEQEDELIVHAIFDCPNGKSIWENCAFKDVVAAAPATSFQDRWAWLRGKLDKPNQTMAGTLAWAAWLCRNKAVFESPVACNINTVVGFMHLVDE
ncbi:hypothetical protein RDABS01_034989 [Bienertia sinuspersici]